MSNSKLVAPRQYWTQLLNQNLVGRYIKEVRYTDTETALDSNWTSIGVELVLDDDSVLVIEADNDASGPGSLTMWKPEQAPVMAPSLEIEDLTGYIGTQN